VAVTDGTDPLARQFRRHAGQVSRQAAVFLAGSVFLAFGGYLFKIYVSRVLGAGGMGLYGLGMTLVAFGAVVAGLGLPPTAARFVAIYDGSGAAAEIRRFAGLGLRWLLLASAAAAAALIAGRELIAERLFGEPELARWLPLFAVVLVLHTCRLFFGQFLRGLRQVARRTVINHFVAFPVKVLTTLALFTLGWGLAGYATAEALSSAVALVLLAGAVRRGIPSPRPSPATGEGASALPNPSPRPSPATGEGASALPNPSPRPSPATGEGASALPGAVLQERGYAASMIGLGVLGFFAGQADVFLLGVFLDASRVGVYTIAVTTAGMVPTLLRSVASIFGPIIADLHARGQSELLERLSHTTTKWCLGLTWPLVVVMAAFSRPLMGLFGDDFEAGAAALAVLAAAQLVNVGVGSVGNLLVMSGNQRWEIGAVALAAAATLALSATMIPRWGVTGAAAAMAVSLVGSNLLRAWMVRRRLGILPWGRGALRLVLPLAASAAAAGAVWWLRPASGVAAVLAALAASYGVFAATAAWTALDRDDRILVDAVREKLGALPLKDR
jgi:O-antigen/teichoic acid export membrane protein